ncbi:MAG: GFA family protein [Pseudomonadota bacterium]
MSGGCQCGKVRYQVTCRPLTLYACHCSECQKQSSSAFGMSMRIRTADLILQGETKARRRDIGLPTEAEGIFCPNCGTRLIHKRPGATEFATLKAGTLDDTSWLVVAGHIWTDSAQRWSKPEAGDLIFPKQPENYDALIEAWQSALICA